jgi:hypothetical protein
MEDPMQLQALVRRDPTSFTVAASRTASASERRVAFRWIRALSGKAIYDEMVRLQVLEGVAGKPEGGWSRRRNLEGAADFFEGTGVHPDWFAKGDQSFIGPILRRLNSILPESRGDLQGGPDDIFQSLAAGISPYTFEKLGGGPIFYQLGKDSSVKAIILKGGTPPEVSAGKGFGAFQNAAKTYWRNHLRKVERMGPTVQEGDDAHGDHGIADPKQGPSIGQVFQEAVQSPTDPLGRKIRDVILDNVPDRGNNRVIIEQWLQDFVSGRKFDAPGLAAQLGISPRGVKLVIERLVGNAKSGEAQATKLLEVVKQNTRLVRELEQRTLAVGGRLARQRIANRIARLERELRSLRG